METEKTYDFDELIKILEDDFYGQLKSYMMDRLDELIEDADDDDLAKELERRGYEVYYQGECPEDVEEIPVHWSKEQLREHMLAVLQMGHYHSDRQIAERVLEELTA